MAKKEAGGDKKLVSYFNRPNTNDKWFKIITPVIHFQNLTLPQLPRQPIKFLPWHISRKSIFMPQHNYM